jgi:hypothetical protein
VRISGNRDDPGYELIADGRIQPLDIEIRLDGKRIHGAVTADDDVHIVIVPKVNADGYLIRLPNGDAATEILYGKKVEILLVRSTTGQWRHRLMPEPTDR